MGAPRQVARRGRAVALLLAGAILASAAPALAETLEFDGRIDALGRADIASRLNGVVTALNFEGGERVEAGEALIELESAPFALALQTAKAEAARAEAQLTLARQSADRVRALSTRNVASDADVQAAEAALAGAQADLAVARTAVERAELDLSHTILRAPIAGYVSRPAVALGTFLEAEAGPPLATIVQLESVLVAYEVPYAVRLETLRRTAAPNLEALFAGISLRLLMPDGQTYSQSARPQFASATLDPETGAVTIWAKVANPDGLLRPGMRLKVFSDIDEAGISRRAGQ